jgi:predicted nuclease of predicted toxin-antitoxin system
MSRFKLDENLPPDFADALHQHGHDVITVWDQAMRGSPDALLAEACRREHGVLVTLDNGFADIRAYPPADFPGLIVLRLERQGRKHLMSIFDSVLSILTREPIEGHLWIVDKRRVQILKAGSEG